MSNHRKIEALRNLAERPGTEAEGRLAREMLKRWESKPETQESAWYWFERYLRTHSMDDLEKATRAPEACACGKLVPRGLKCVDLEGHERLDKAIRERFPRGQRVYYNYWAYSVNCPAVVVGYSSKDWSWIRLKFDHLKNSRAGPIYKAGKCHLSTEPLTASDLVEQPA